MWYGTISSRLSCASQASAAYPKSTAAIETHPNCESTAVRRTTVDTASRCGEGELETNPKSHKFCYQHFNSMRLYLFRRTSPSERASKSHRPANVDFGAINRRRRQHRMMIFWSSPRCGTFSSSRVVVVDQTGMAAQLSGDETASDI